MIILAIIPAGRGMVVLFLIDKISPVIVAALTCIAASHGLHWGAGDSSSWVIEVSMHVNQRRHLL